MAHTKLALILHFHISMTLLNILADAKVALSLLRLSWALLIYPTMGRFRAEYIFLPIPAILFGLASHTSLSMSPTSKLLDGKAKMFFLLLKECITVSMVMVIDIISS